MQLAPAAGVGIPQFDEVYGSLVLIVPGGQLQLMLPGIDSHERARPDQRIHGEVVQTNVTIGGWRGAASLLQREWHPDWQSCSRHETGTTLAKAGTRRGRKGLGELVILVFCRHELSQMWISNGLVFLNLTNINVIKPDQIEELNVIDHAQTEKLANAWLRYALL